MIEETTQSVDTGDTGQESPAVDTTGPAGPGFSTAGNEPPPQEPWLDQSIRNEDLDPYASYRREKARRDGSYRDPALTPEESQRQNEEILERRRQQREGVTTAPQQPAFDLAPAFNAWQANPQATPQDFWQTLPQQSQLALANHVIDVHAEQIAQSLVDAGILPAEALYEEPQITPEMLREIPRDLREVAATLSPEAFEELTLLPPHLRDQYLEERRELEDFRRQEVERQAEEARQDEREAQKQFDGAMTKAVESTNNLIAEHFAGHMLHLEQSFSPFPDKQQNRELHQSILTFAVAQVMRDEEARIMDHNVHAHLAHAAFQDAVGQLAKALSHRSAAKDLAKRLNDRITPVRDAYVNLFRNNFAGVYQPPAQHQPQPTAH